MKRLLLLLALVCPLVANSQAIKNKHVTPVNALLTSAVRETSVSQLPIRRVILYSNGVSYIERRGMVSGNAEINLSFKQSQVDDVLKSMVVLDLGQGKIGAVSYNSSAPISSRMSEIPFSVNPVSGDGGGISSVLAQLQGAKVIVTSAKGTATGSIMTIERRQMKTDKETLMTSILVIASESGEISSFDLNDVRSVKLLDEGTRKDLNEFANATASTRRLDAKTITVTSQGSGPREMVVSYTIAAPIWKTTYRVVLDKEGKPFFQGWAIVDNVSDEDWQNVHLSMVSGAPISFIQPIQKPLYRYRPVIPMPDDLQLTPQVYESGSSAFHAGSSIFGTVQDQNGAVIPGASVTITNTSNGATYSAMTDSEGEFSRDGFASGGYTVSIFANGFKRMVVQNAQPGREVRVTLQVGGVSETVTVMASTEAVNTSQSSVSLSNSYYTPSTTSVSDALQSKNSGVETAAVGKEIGDLFEYRIEQPVTVNRNRSALIPIIQTKMDGERVAVYDESVRQDRPYSGVLLKNTTDLTLESGSLTVLEGDAYAGEALMERLKPKEQRLISFALDLGTHVTVRQTGDREPAKLIKVVNGVFQVHYFQGDQKTYQISNQTNKPKVLYLQYPIRDGWELSDTSPKPDYTTQRYYRFRVELKPFEEKEMIISVRQPLMDTYQLNSLQRTDLLLFVSRGYIDEATRAKLEKIIDLRTKIAEVANKLDSFDDEVEKIESDQKRLRENIEALSKTPEAKTLITRYIEKAGQQETRIEAMDKERKDLESEKARLDGEFAGEIRNFEIK
ncbi:MAG: carboxypeptidase regulatory-like domain-containing protein [Acidobacteriota bacterium]